MIVVPTVLAIPAAPVLPTVSAVPAVLLIAVVPVVPVIGIVAMAAATGTAAAVVDETEEQNGRGHPPDGVEETEADQSHDEDEKQDEHGRPPGAEQVIAARGWGFTEQSSPAQELRIAPPVESYCRVQTPT
jgi:flagellar biosynthesis component FlhA